MNAELAELCYENGCRRLRGHTGSHDAFTAEAWSFLAEKDGRKLTKAGFATPRGGAKGAYQNHVDRSNKVIIPFEFLDKVDLSQYQDGWVIRLFPHQYFASAGHVLPAFAESLNWIKVGTNAFVLYRTHASFEQLPPPAGWSVRSLAKDGLTVTKRGKGVADIGEYVIRLPTLSAAKKNVSRDRLRACLPRNTPTKRPTTCASASLRG